MLAFWNSTRPCHIQYKFPIYRLILPLVRICNSRSMLSKLMNPNNPRHQLCKPQATLVHPQPTAAATLLEVEQVGSVEDAETLPATSLASLCVYQIIYISVVVRPQKAVGQRYGTVCSTIYFSIFIVFLDFSPSIYLDLHTSFSISLYEEAETCFTVLQISCDLQASEEEILANKQVLRELRLALLQRSRK